MSVRPRFNLPSSGTGFYWGSKNQTRIMLCCVSSQRQPRGAMHNELMAEHHGAVQVLDSLLSLLVGALLPVSEN